MPSVSNSSTASSPVTSSRSAIRRASCWAAATVVGSRSGAGARTSTHCPSRCTVSTTGHAAACPWGERATCTASSRRIVTACSAISGVPAASSCATSAGSGPSSSHTPRPSYPPRTALSTIGQPVRARESVDVRGVGGPRRTPACRARPSSARRIDELVLGVHAARPGPAGRRRLRPTSARSSSAGTPSWSNVTASAPRASPRRASRSSGAPRCTSAQTSAAGSPGDAASTRSD